jgi:uncharacterized RmlC-like cupin family protein
MKTIQIDQEQMEARIARFRELRPRTQAYEKTGIPQELFHAIAAKNIYSYMANPDAGGANKQAKIKGAEGLTVMVCECPAGTGPLLHTHQNTVENFFCLDSRFEVSWGDAGEYRVVLEPMDMISVPPLVTRTFKNVGDQEGHLLVFVQGSNKALNDISYSPQVGQDIVERFGADAKQRLETTVGWKFTAGVDE